VWPEPVPPVRPSAPRVRDSRLVRASFGLALAVALVAVVLAGSLVAAEHFRADLRSHTDLALAGLAALGLLAEVADVVTRIVRWGFRRPPAAVLAPRTPLTWAPQPPPPPEPPALAPVVPLRRRDRREQEQERRQVQAALILGPGAPLPSPAPAPTPRPKRRDREPRTHLVPRPERRREPRQARQPKGLFVRWAHAERDGKVAVWLRGPTGTQVVEGTDQDDVEAEARWRRRESAVRGADVGFVTGGELKSLAREWAEREGAGQ
jgi:hypothetical protein